MNWKLVYLPEAEKDFKELSGNERIVVAKALKKVLKNPLPVNEGGYSKPKSLIGFSVFHILSLIPSLCQAFPVSKYIQFSCRIKISVL